MNQSSHLFQLQKIDIEIDQGYARILAIQIELLNDSDLVEAEKLKKTAEAGLRLNRQKLKTIEEEVNSLNLKKEISEASLYGGKVRNPKELQDLQAEIESIKRRIANAEDEQIEAMMVVESSEAQLRILNENLAAIDARRKEKTTLLDNEKMLMEKKLERLNIEKNAAFGSILPENMAIYQKLRTQKRGIAVAEIEDNSCAVCGSSVRPAEIQAAKSPKNLAYCSSCGRIFFAR